MNLDKIKALFIVKILLVTTIYTALVFNSIVPVEAQTIGTACCERTLDGNSCEYISSSECDPNFKSAFTTCDNTQYCQVGCCLDSEEGQCFSNSPKSLCEEKGGTFSNDASCGSVAQCQQGCCTLGTETSFTTLTQCKNAASQFPGVEFQFDTSITSEVACLQQARTKETGCCVNEDSCSYTTQDACNAVQGVNASTGFFAGTFCSNDNLACTCAPQQQKGCLLNEDDVYWFDSCGNSEGVAEECDYSSGTLCGENDNGEFSCLSTSCTGGYDNAASPDAGGTKRSGESWCIYDAGTGFGNDPVGSRHYRGSCANGVEYIEPCRDYREEFCISADFTFAGFSEDGNEEDNPYYPGSGQFTGANCRENRFSDCSACEDENCCSQADIRDCFWVPYSRDEGQCLPHVPPGHRFWEGEGADVCAQGNQECEVTYIKKGSLETFVRDDVLGGLGDFEEFECVNNCHCLEKDWVVNSNSICKSLGDCGAYFNINGDASVDGFTYIAPEIEKQEDDEESGENSNYTSPDSERRHLKPGDLGSFARLAAGGPPYEAEGTWQKYWDAVKAGVISYGVTVGIMSIAQGTVSSQILWDSAFIGPSSVVGGLEGEGLYSYSNAARTAYETTYGTTYSEEALRLIKDKAMESAKSVHQATVESAEILYSETLDSALEEGAGSFVAELRAEDALFEQFGSRTVDEVAGQLTDETLEQIGEQAVQEVTTTSLQGGISQALAILNTVMWIYTIYNIINVFTEDEVTIAYSTSCEPWVAPKGGANCDECNNRGDLGCSEYECKSFGQGCEVLNPGSEEEICAFVSANDFSPPRITPLDEVIKPSYSIESTPSGFKVVPEIKAFEVVTVGVKTDEPAQCKITDQIGSTFDEMSNFLGSSSYSLKHSLTFNLPSELAESAAFEITNGGNYNFFVRCQDGNGNQNVGDYTIEFSLDSGPDLTAPTIVSTSIFSGSYIANDVSEVELSIFTNEPSQCNWETFNTEIDSMANSFECVGFGLEQSTNLLYECKTTLIDIKPIIENNYFFRCRDLKGNTMSESFEFDLQGTIPLSILSVEPSGQVFEATLEVETDGGALIDGSAICGYSLENDPDSMLTFFETGGNLHTQQLFIDDGTFTYYIQCIDQAGNTVDGQTTFTLFKDEQAPVITRIYEDKTLTQAALHITTNEPSSCEYTTVREFSFGEGQPMPEDNSVNHEAVWGASAYYVICKDEFDNVSPLSIIYI